MKVLIIGGVAAGASAAARIRRLDETAEIVILERGKYISYANCGLPYYLGGVIPSRNSLLVASAEKFHAWYRINVRTEHEVTAIHPAEKRVDVRTADGAEYQESYDRLLIATGSSPIQMDIPGSADPRIQPLWTIPDMDRIQEFLVDGAREAIVVGAGFIGLETAENLLRRGLKVTVVELAPQVLPQLDQTMAFPIAGELLSEGIQLRLGRKVTAFETAGPDQKLFAVLDSGERIPADLAVMSVGVRPNSDLARDAGLELGPRGHIRVNERLQTSDPFIYAAGDAVEVLDPISDTQTAVPLAGPANRQGRVAAECLTASFHSENGGTAKTPVSVYSGTYGASVLKVGALTAGSTGLSQRRLTQMGIPHHKIYLHPSSSASYYPGASQLHMELLFDDSGKILGGQVVGAKGVDKQIDTLTAAMRGGLTVRELALLESSYSPPYHTAKTPLNYAGMIASNVLDGLSQVTQPEDYAADGTVLNRPAGHSEGSAEVTAEGSAEIRTEGSVGIQFLDVRQPEEYALGTVPGALNVPLPTLREKLSELDPNREYAAFCKVGLRGYLAERILRANGFRVKNLTGGFTSWQMAHSELPEPKVLEPVVSPVPTPAESVPLADSEVSTASAKVESVSGAVPNGTLEVNAELDVRGIPCPGPIVRLKKQMDELPTGAVLRLLAQSSFQPDLAAWCASSGTDVLELQKEGEELAALLRKNANPSSGAGSGNVSESGIPDSCPVSGPCAQMVEEGNRTLAGGGADSASIVLFSNDLDRAMAALIIACGMAAAGRKTGIFFTFWGLSVLRKNPAPKVPKTFISKMFGWMLPKGSEKLKLSKMNFAGAGTLMMKSVMWSQNVTSLPELIRQARELGVRFIACEMAMNVMGITREELIDVDEVAGVASFVEMSKGGNSLFI